MTEEGAIQEEITLAWGEIASKLLRAESEQAWKGTHLTLSAYIEKKAEELNRTKSTIWRLRTAGRYYNELREKLDPDGKRLPSLDDPQISASPESLELLSKISRVAPFELVEDLERRTMQGEISRRELRELWEAYRPVLGGRTKRGRNGQAPTFDKRDFVMTRALLEANVLAQVVKAGPKWLGIQHLHLYRAVHITGSRSLHRLHPSLPDLVLLTAEEEGSRLMIHGVEAGHSVENNRFLRNFDPRYAQTDYAWFAMARPLNSRELAKVPPEIGVIEAASQIRVARKAEPLHARENEEFLRAILKEMARGRRSVWGD